MLPSFLRGVIYFYCACLSSADHKLVAKVPKRERVLLPFELL